MKEVAEIVSELILHHNCVVIPNFGGFVAAVVPSKIEGDKCIITPPSKAISFNQNLTSNDGLLVSAFAQANQKVYEEAHLEIDRFVTSAKQQLQNGQRIEFSKIGFVYLNKEGNIAFEQDRFVNLLLETYGLGTIQFIPHKESKKSAEETVTIEKETSETISISEGKAISNKATQPTEEKQETPMVALETKPASSIIRKIGKYAAVAAIVPLAFYSFWIPLNTDVLQSRVLFKDDFNPFKNRPTAIYESIPEKSSDLLVTPIEETTSLEKLISKLPADVNHFYFGIDEDHYVPVKLNKSESTSAANNTAVHVINGYHLIAGCFAHEGNAKDLVKTLQNKGFNAFVVDVHNGLHRVSVEQSESRKAILSARKQMKAQGISTWLLKK